MDAISSILLRFSVTARVFFSGRLCTTEDFDATEGVGYLHVLRQGNLLVSNTTGGEQIVDQPSFLFYSRPFSHRFYPIQESGVELVCASVDLGTANPLFTALPGFQRMPLAEVPEIQPALDLLFLEAFVQRSGRQAALDRLIEYILILLIRHLIDSKTFREGLLAGLADSRLARALTAMHERQSEAWSLERLAEEAGMSRARFAHHFKKTVGQTPLSYLTDYRIGLAKNLLKQRQPVMTVAHSVGYQSPAAFARTFQRKCGIAPSEWLKSRS